MTSVAVVEQSLRLKNMLRSALSVALMYLGLLAVQYLPTGDAFFFTATAVVLMAVVLLCGWLWAALAFLALAILAFSTLSLATIWPFFLAYGLWIFIKLGIEWLCFTREWPLWRDYALKALAALALSLLARFVFLQWFLGQAFQGLRERLGVAAELWPVALFILILAYDYALTLAKRLLAREVFPHLP